MKLSHFILILPILLIRVCPQVELEENISLMTLDPTVLETKGLEVYQYWEFDNQAYLWQTEIGEVPSIQAYKDSLSQFLDEERYQSAVNNKSQLKPLRQSELDTLEGPLKNSELVLQGVVGTVRSMNYLEAEILNYQLSRYPLFSHPTEFHGFIATHDSLNLVRVFFASSDQPWPPKPGIVITELEKALDQGWKLTYHLHNHYNDPEDDYVGVLAPSLPDAQYFKALRSRFDLQNALVTNGFHTVEIKASELDQFDSH